MSLDLLALKALVGVARVSLEEARIVLDESRATSEDLSDATLGPVWNVLESRIRNRQGIDVVGIRHALARQPAAVIATAVDCVLEPDLGQPRERLGLLRDAAIRRRLVEAMRAIAVATKADVPLSELDALARELPGLLASRASRVRNCAGDSVAMLDRLEQAWAGKESSQLTMGLGDLDEVLGACINNLYAVGARTGVGKSALIAGLVKSWTSRGFKVGVLCYEDDAIDMEARIVASLGGCSVKHARGDVLGNEYTRGLVAHGLELWSKREHLLEVDDARPSGSAADVLSSFRQMVDRGCRVILLDNMKGVRLDGPEGKRHDLIVEDALRGIRDAAQSLHVPAFVVGHLKRGDGPQDEATKPPKLSDFSNAQAFEDFCRVALAMWRSPEGVRLRVLKQTNGSAGQDFAVDFHEEAAVVVGTRQLVATPQQAPQRRTYSRSRGDES